MHLSFSGWVSALMLLLSTFVARGQSDSLAPVDAEFRCNEYCCYEDPAPAGMMYSHLHPQGQWMISYRYMNMAMGNMYDGTSKVSNEEIFNQYIMSSNSMQMQMHMLMAMYGLSDRITLMAMLNYNVSSMNMATVSGGGHHHGGSSEPSHTMRTNGFGDTEISAMYALIEKSYYNLSLIGGLSIPTGSIQEKGNSGEMYEGDRLPYAMQNGSGTWDVQPGVNYSFKKRRFMYSAQVLSTIRTGYNNADYKLGNDLTLNNWVAYQWSDCFSSSVRIEGYTAAQIQGKDPDLYTWYEPSANPANYGGDKVSTYVGAAYVFRTGALKNNKVGAEFGIPLYQSLNGPQMGTKSNLYASWILVF